MKTDYYIEFDSQFKKLHAQKTATLLNVKLASFVDMHVDFKKYDTEREDGTHRQISKTCPKMLLTFLGNKNIPFSTIRTIHSKAEWEFYTSTIGENFTIIISEHE